MFSQNEWYVCGDVAGINIRKRSVVLSIHIRIFRPKLFKVKGTIDCVMSKQLYESADISKKVAVTGHMIFGENNHMLVETLKDAKEVSNL